MSIKLDLKKFKHLKSDKDSTTLQHEKDGHQITLAHKALSPQNKEQLIALSKLADSESKPSDKGEDKADKAAKGSGTVHNDNTAKGMKQAESIKKEGGGDKYGSVIVSRSAEDKARDKSKEDLKSKMSSKEEYAQGGEVQRYAYGEGSVLDEEPTKTPEQTEADYQLVMGPGSPTPLDILAQQKSMSEQAPIEESPIQKGDLPPIPEAARAGNPNEMIAAQMAGPVAQAPQQAAPAQPQQAPTDQGIPNQQALMQDPQAMMADAYQKQQQAITGIGSEQAKLAQEQAGLYEQQAADKIKAKAVYDEAYKGLESERQAHMQDIKDGYVDPAKYWTGDSQGNGSHSKIAAGIGMILAGFNPTNSPNAAINFLNHQMDMNIQSQKANLDSKQNLLAANLKQFGNLKDATDMTRLMQADVLQNELLTAGAKAQSPMAKLAAQQAVGQLEQAYAPIAQNFAMRNAMMHLSNNSDDPSNTRAAEQMIAYARMTNPEMAKEMESRLIPGVGMAKVPISEGVRKELVEKQGLDVAARDLMAYSKKHTNIVPGTAEYNYGVSKALAFQQKVREGLLGTVFRESEKPLLEKFVKENPAGALKAFSTQPQLKAIIDSNTMGLNAIKQSHGLPVKAEAAEPQIKIVNGVKYMRGPDGKAIRVK